MKPQCIICAEKFASDSVVSAGVCGHSFHKECISKWMMLNNKCPMALCNVLMQHEKLIENRSFASTSTSEVKHNTNGNGSEAEKGPSLIEKLEYV